MFLVLFYVISLFTEVTSKVQNKCKILNRRVRLQRVQLLLGGRRRSFSGSCGGWSADRRRRRRVRHCRRELEWGESWVVGSSPYLAVNMTASVL